MNTPAFLRSLQERPYEQRIKFLWFGTALSAVIVIAAWWGLSKLFPAQTTNTPESVLNSFKKQLDGARDNLPDLKNPSVKPKLAGLPADYRAMTTKNFSVNKEKKQLLINFSVSNPTTDILIFLNQTRSNLLLIDGSSPLSPVSIKLNGDVPFPSKILSKATYLGQIVFPLPQSTEVALQATDMYFETQPSQVFSEKLGLGLGPNVRGTETISLPRE